MISNLIMTGIGRKMFVNQIQEGQFKDGILHGFARVIYKDYGYFQGEYLNGKENGYGKFNYESGNQYIGYFQNGYRNGYGKYTFKNGDIW